MKSLGPFFSSSLVFVVGLFACGGDTTPESASSSGGSGGASSSGAASSGETPSPNPSGTSSNAPPPAPPSSVTCTGKEKLAGDLEWTLKPTDMDRKVKVHVPTSYDPSKGTSVVLNFHGLSGSANQQATYAGMIAKSDSAGFVAVHAEGIGFVQSWNAGTCCGTAAQQGTKDVEFVAAILDELDKKVCVDKKRIFSTGLSNGGFLSHRLACELSDRIAAIAPVAGVVGVPTCNPKRAIPVMQFHGTQDTLVPFNGNPTYPAVPETMAKWAERNKCTDQPRETFKKDDVTCTTQSACEAGAEVTLCKVEGGGHTWPGATDAAGGFLGKTTKAIVATDAMWDFFQKHPMP